MTPEEEEAIRREFEEARSAGHEEAAQQDQGPSQFVLNNNSEIGQVIGVISGKGGVGKSLVTGILATELVRAGKTVGILDADITGPSIPKMLGLSGEHIMAVGELILPATTKGGIKVVSTNLALEHETDPVIWRGPILMGAIQQFYEQSIWGKLDYLLVDMPPGTGDVALTVFQSLPVDGVVIVSSPQDLVQMVVGKAVNMAAMMNVPVVGLDVCPDCGKHLEPFGPSRAQSTVDAFGIDLLGKLPIDPAIAELCDKGTMEQDLPAGLLDNVVDLIGGKDA